MRGEERKVHPNDDVNKSQSSNDVFPTAMHVAAVIALREHLIPELKVLHKTLSDKAEAYRDIAQNRPHPPAGRHAADPGRRSPAGRRCWRTT